MKVFCDSSAIVAMTVKEKGWDELSDTLDRYDERFVSAVVAYEVTLALARIRDVPVRTGKLEFEDFVSNVGMKHVPIDETVSQHTLLAFERFGKGQGHKAKLNMGDCFSYACAKAIGAALLCKGDDFIHTDIKIA
jgi:ribonuclease VapC